MKNYNEVKKLVVWCQKVLPLVYDDSLSYYEVLCKVVKKLNEVIEDINAIPDYIDSVIDDKLDEEYLAQLIRTAIGYLEGGITSSNEEDNTNFSSRYDKGDLIWWHDYLYILLKDVDAGDSILDTGADPNVERTDVETILDDFTNVVMNCITDNNEGASKNATQNYDEGEWVWLDGVLYEALTYLAQGTAFVKTGVNANVKTITVEECYFRIYSVLGDLNNLTTTDKNTLVGAINEVNANIGDLSSLSTTDKSNIVNAVNEVNDNVNAVNENIGDLSTLDTTDKSNIVNAINEVCDNIGDIEGDLVTINSAINNIDNAVDLLTDIYSSYYEVNVLYPPEDDDIPLVADWASANSYTDNTPLFQALVDKYGSGTTYYFPAGFYGFSSTVSIPYNQIKIYGNGSKYTRLHMNNSVSHEYPLISLGSTTERNGLLCVEQIGFICDSPSETCNCIKLNNPRTCYFDNILFVDFTNDIFYDAIIASAGQTSIFRWLNHSVTDRTTQSRMFYFNRASDTIFPNGILIENCHGSFGQVGRFIEGYACDIWIYNCNIAFCTNAINLTCPHEYVSGEVHISECAFADSVGHAIVLRYFNRAVVITNNFIEQYHEYTSVLSAFRINACNGVIITGNTIGTERNILNHHIGVLLVEGDCKDFVVANNIGYLGAYVVQMSSATMSSMIIANNFFSHVGSNTSSANAFYLTGVSDSMIHDNRLKEFSTICNSYSLNNVKTFHNMIETASTLNTPFVSADNYII